MSGATTISQSGNLGSVISPLVSGNYLIEGQGVTITADAVDSIAPFDNITIATGADLDLATGIVSSSLDNFTIAPGGTLDIGANLSLADEINFSGTGNGQGAELVVGPFSAPVSLVDVSGFGAGDMIDFQGVGAPTGTYSSFFDGLHTDFTVSLQSGMVDVFSLNGNLANAALTVTPDNAGGFILSDAPCFAAGTAILTTDGEVLVEHLAPGDTAVLADFTTAAIKFIGRRKLNLLRHPRPETVRPVRIQPGALGNGLPARQLTLSPDHALFIDGVLVQAKDLIDNATIFQDNAVADIEYFHIELAAHGILLAEGAAAESYLDTGNRGMFENGGEPLVLHPDLMQMRRDAESIAPLCKSGPTLTAIRGRLAARKRGLGLSAVETLALAARTAGRALTPVVNTRSEVIFAIPRGAVDLLITTPVFTPADFDPASTDRRKLGLALSAIIVDGTPMSPESLATTGLHKRAAADAHAWTTGALRLKLPAGTQRIELRIAARPQNWHFNPKAA